ncbi:hypothetical protein PoB_001680600 [Plakobranchus ocellatus]|uniref:C-type lectin domain-containing protein n=1 Tax=Plakobranchus ocellatus TaxID=259542 RepID=A0AAV3Z341_9GAST|nr:hypothetical protein PoB_001680600 [Plakobranchus ocellatus]
MACMQLWTVTLVATLAVPSLSEQTASMNFIFSTTTQSATRGLKLCKELGYDGLGILSTPEAYAYALRTSLSFRMAEYIGFYIGLKRRSDPTRLEWHDGSLSATDMPVLNIDSLWGSVNQYGYFRMVNGDKPKYALCGNREYFSQFETARTP